MYNDKMNAAHGMYMCFKVLHAYLHDCMQKVLAMAVRMVMITLMIDFQFDVFMVLLVLRL